MKLVRYQSSLAQIQPICATGTGIYTNSIKCLTVQRRSRQPKTRLTGEF